MQNGAHAYVDTHRQKRRWLVLLACMAAVVALCTMCALMMPASTLETKTVCGTEEHSHDSSCYEATLICGQEEDSTHAHDESCYEDALVCDMTEHTHTDACYEETSDTSDADASTLATAASTLASGVSTLAVGDEYQLSYTAQWSTSGGGGGGWWGGQQGGSSTINETNNTFTIVIVDGSGNSIDLSNVTFNTSISGASQTDSTYTISYTQSSSSGNNSSYTLSNLAQYFTVTVDGTTYSYSSAKIGTSASTASTATAIRYGSNNNSSNYNWQYQSSSGNFGNSWSNITSIAGVSNVNQAVIYLVYTNPKTPDLSSYTFQHIDVKTAAAYTGEENLGSVAEIYNNRLTYTTTRNGQETETTVRLTKGTNEWTHNNQDSGNFDSSTTITITFSLDATSSTDQNATWYTSTITADTVYPDNTYYPADGDCAYKLYNYLYGTTFSNEQAWERSSYYGDIDISGMSVFLVSAIVCNGSTVSNGQLTGVNGLDLVLNVATLLSASPNFNFDVEKTLTGTTDNYEGTFSFTLQEATVNDDNVWTVGSENQTLTTNSSSWSANTDEDSIYQTLEGTQITYASSTTTGSTSYYYILSEDSGSDTSVTYDTTVYGIKVVVMTTQTSQTGSSLTEYETTIESVTIYELKANENGGYTQVEELSTEDESYSVNNNGEYVFPFENTMTSTGSLTITKEVSGATVNSKEYSFTISTTELSVAGQSYSINDDDTVVTFSSEATSGRYTATVTVSATTNTEGEDGSITITGLPLGSYTVTENTTGEGVNIDITGYRFDSVTYGDSSSNESATVTLSTDSATATVNVTNTYTQVVDITVTKIDAQNNTALAKAEFYLTNSEGKYYFYDESTETVSWAESKESATKLISSDDEGIFTIYGLENGTYYLEETKAPDGYQLPSESITITVSNGSVASVSASYASYQDNTITVKNTTGQKLPETGGSGTTYLTISGLLLVAIAVGGGFATKRLRRRGGAFGR